MEYAYLKVKLVSLNETVKNKNIRDLCRGKHEFKQGYQFGTNLVKDDIGNLLADFQVFLVGGRITFVSYLHGTNDVRRTEIQTAGLLVTEPSLLRLILQLNV